MASRDECIECASDYLLIDALTCSPMKVFNCALAVTVDECELCEYDY